MEEFKKSNNINMLFEIAKEERMIPQLNDGSVHVEYFMKKIHDFVEREKKSSKSMKQLNIEFLQSFIPSVSLRQNEPKAEYVERAGRMPEWEQQVKKKENEFQTSFLKQVPQEPNFRDPWDDGPIQNMEQLISKTIQNRNLEMNEIQVQMKKPVGKERSPIKYIEIGEEISVKPEWIELDEDDEHDEDNEGDGKDIMGDNNRDNIHHDSLEWRRKMEYNINEIKYQIADLKYLFRTLATNSKQMIPSLMEDREGHEDVGEAMVLP